MTARAHELVILLTVVAALYIFHLVRLRQLRSKYALLWMVIGFTLLPFAAAPSLLEDVSEWVGIKYAPMTFVLVAIGFLFFVVVHFSWELSRLESRVRTLAEELALLRAREEQEEPR